MAKIDVYLRSIERFGAAGALLTSGQSVTLRFPTGDRHATQVTPHDQLVMMVREVAPPNALDAIDGNRPARFDIDSQGVRYTLAIAPKPGNWQVAIEPAAAAPPPVTSVPVARASQARVAPAPVPADVGELAIERGQYDVVEPVAAVAASGSTLLDQLTQAARGARATDVYVATGTAPTQRVNGEVRALGERGPLDAETLSRELGIVAPGEARAAWTEHGLATFTYSDGMGRVRATLVRDRRGPGAALRLLVGEPVQLDRLGAPREVAGWLDQRGLVLIAGASGSGKTTTLAAIVHALGERQRRVVVLEDPIEIVHASPWISQRAVGEHVPSLAGGIAAAMREGAEAIAVGAVDGAETAAAVVDAVAAGHLVIAALAAPVRDATRQLVERLPADRRELARGVLERAVLGTVGATTKGGSRTFEVGP